MEPVGTELGGNTIPLATRGSYAKKWCFTLNNYTEDEYQKIKNLCGTNGTYIIGKEVGSNGTPHLQGYFECKKRIRAIQFFGMKNIHFEKARGSSQENYLYCSKEKNFETNLKLKRPLKLIEKLYDWQQWIVDIVISEPDDRTIYWIWDEIGNTGKTALCKFMCSLHNAVIIDGKKDNILYVCAEFESDCYLFDLSRSVKEQKGLYDTIEKVKNGLFMCGKYESKPIVRNSPHVIIFANYPPDKDKLSLDRWKIFHIDEIKEIAGVAKKPPEGVITPS